MDFFRWLNSMGTQQPAVRIPDGSPAPPVRRGFRFSGVVQGVGFRYEVQRIAAQLDLTGWVRNQSDGSVTVEIEGPSNFIDSFLLAVEAVPRFHITDIQAEELPLAKGETAFQICY